MPLENFAEPEVAVAAAAAAVVASPSLRNVVRRSLVYGLAGALIAFDRTAAATRGIAQGVQKGVAAVTPNQKATANGPASEPQQTGQSPTT